MDPFGLILPKAPSANGGRPSASPERGGEASATAAQPLDRGNLFQQVLGTSDYMKAWRKKHREVSEQYQQEKHRLHEDMRRQEKDLKKQLDKREEQINRWQGVTRLKADDPRKPRAEQAAGQKYDKYERDAMRNFDRQKREALRSLQKQRDERTRGIRRELMGR